MKTTKTTYICELPQKTQKEIKEELKAFCPFPCDVDIALNSRLCDLEEIIDINKYIK